MSVTAPTVWLLDDTTPSAVVVPDGWTGREGFALPDRPWDLADRRWVCVGVVADLDGSTAAMTAVARGVSLAISVALDGASRQRLLEDLHKSATVEPYVAPPPAHHAFGPTHVELLDALARGATVTAAAEEVHVSRRTANRLLTDVRAHYGVESTAAAISRWTAERGRQPAR